MNIVLSLIPPKLMKLANLLGFSGNRRLGLQALEFASQSQDMKAPLARSVSEYNRLHMCSDKCRTCVQYLNLHACTVTYVKPHCWG